MTLLFIVVTMHAVGVPALWADNLEDKPVTVDIKSGTIHDFFAQVKQQTGLVFIMSGNGNEALPDITIKCKDMPLHKVLKNVMSQIHADYEIENGIVTIHKGGYNGTRIVRGTVTDEDGLPLPGVNVTSNTGKQQAVTNIDGQYTITVPSNVKSLEFSYVGMERQNVNVGNKSDRIKKDIVMKSDNQLSEVLVTGLMNRDSKTFTGNAAVYKGDELQTVGRQNFLKSLSLLDPSVSLTENIDMGSNPNTMPEVRLRGESSFSGFKNIDKSGLSSDPNQPLFILDGYETTVERVVDLDMNRIESVTVLKDAAAGAIYGARAANGVIVIKTKRPKEGQLNVSYNVDVDFTLPDLSSYDLLNARENLELINRLGLYRNYDGTLRPEYNEIA